MRFKFVSSAFVLLCLIASLQSFSQTKTMIDYSGKRGSQKTIDGITKKFIIDSVTIRHNNTTVKCDSAEINREENNFKAYGNVYVITKDSVEIFSDRLFYFGKTQKSYFYENVKLIDSTSTLTTNYLVYDRKTKSATFNNWGTIVDDSTTLISKTGEYFSDSEEFLFIDSVEVTNPEYVINTDTLWYNRKTEFIRFFGPTTFTGKDKYMFALKGWTDTKKDITSLKTSAYIQDKEKIIQGDSVYYDKQKGYGYALKNASFEDTKNDMILSGQIFEYIKEDGYAYATDSALAIMTEKKDSLYLHADTIKIILDTADKAEYLHAFDKARFYRKDLQGICDKLIYSLKDSVISMYQQPILWSDDNQLSSDSTKIFMANKAADSLILYNNAFIVSQDSTVFNQIKGRNVIGYFINNELRKITVNGNSETIYYIRDDETKDIQGINKAMASNMIISLENKKLKSILYLDNPKATLYPLNQISENERKLNGFKWLNDQRPISKEDVFREIKNILPNLEIKPEPDSKMPPVENLKPPIKGRRKRKSKLENR
jgi:lipopolysaccharide export system protein LptA